MLTKDHISKTLEGSEINMEVDTEGEHTGESILNVTDENIRQDDLYDELMTVPSDDEGEDISFTAEDTYNFHVSVAVTDLQSDEINAEFTDAIEEIDGTKNFPCSHCEKVCKSKGGLTRHTRSKHLGDKQVLGETRAALAKETVHSIVETIKAKLKKENLYGSEVSDNLATVSSTDALFDALSLLYKTFCRSKSQDKLLENFYGLIPQSCELLKCKDYRTANLVMIHIPEHLIGFYNTPKVNEEASTSNARLTQLDPAERGPLSYVAGYVISKLFQLNRRKKEGNQELQSLLQNMKSSETNNYISARTRGGLVTPCNDLVAILEVAEISFRENVDESKISLRSIPVEIICDSTLASPTVKSLWENIVFSCEGQPSKSTQKLCLENIVKLYLRVRAFSYTRDFITKYRIKEKQSKKKALRKEMKKAEGK